ILTVQDLLTLASRGNAKKWIREARREMSRLTRLAFVDEYHVPTLAAIQDELLTILHEWTQAWKAKAAGHRRGPGQRYGFRWGPKLDLDQAETGDPPTPTEIAQRLIGLVACTSWKTVEAVVGKF